MFGKFGKLGAIKRFITKIVTIKQIDCNGADAIFSFESGDELYDGGNSEMVTLDNVINGGRA